MIIPPGYRSGAGSVAALGAIRTGAAATGVDAGFLEALARVESGLRSDLKARTSTAAGLFQFIEATWLDLLHRHGAKHGLGLEGLVAVEPGRAGASRFRFASAESRQAALDLRFDPGASSSLAAEYVKENSARLADLLARPPQPADLYMAHFLGPGDSRRFFQELDRAPNADASRIFPAPAAANRGVFFTREGVPRSLREIYELFAERLPEPVAATKAASAESTEVVDPAAGTSAPSSVGGPTLAPAPMASPMTWRAAAIALLTLRLDWPADDD